MSENFKPADHSTVSPYLIVDGADRTIEFLTTVFDAELIFRMADASGNVQHAEVRIDDTVLMLVDGMEGWPSRPAHVYVYVPDVDATYQRAIEAGAESLQEPAKRDDPDRRCCVKDAGGTTWWIATYVGS